jgi:hypothetical protein
MLPARMRRMPAMMRQNPAMMMMAVARRRRRSRAIRTAAEHARGSERAPPRINAAAALNLLEIRSKTG